MTTLSWFVLYGKLFFSRYCFILYFACMLCLYFINILHLHTHIKGRENLRLFVQHDIALKVPFSFLFIKIIFAMIFSLIYSLSCIENITGSVSLRSVIIFATHEKLGSFPLLQDYKFMSFDWTILSSAHDFCKQIWDKKVWQGWLWSTYDTQNPLHGDCDLFDYKNI